MDLFTLFGKIAVNDKEANKSIDNVTGKAKQAEGKMSLAFSKIGKVVAGAFTVAAVAGFEKKIVSTYATYDDQMRKVQAVSGATGKQFEMLRGKAEELGAKTRFSATEAGQGMENLARAGWKTGEIMSGIGPVLSFATANAIDLGSAAGIVSDGLSQFGLKAKDTGMFTDVLSATAAAANTDIGLLGETLKYCGAPAGALGYKLQDVSVAIGLMANKGIKGSQAGTTLRSAFTKLVNPTGDSAKKLKELGVSMTDSTGKVKPFVVLMNDLRKKFSTLSDAQKAQYASTIFGQEAMSGMLAVVNSSDEEFNKMTKAIAESNGKTQEMANTMDGGLGGAIAGVKSAFEGLLIKLGKMQDGVLVRSLKGIAVVLQNIPSAIDLVQNAFSGLFNVIQSNPIVQSLIEPIKLFKQNIGDMSVTEAFHQSLCNMFPNGSLLVSDFVGGIEFGVKGLIAFIKGDTEKAKDMFYTMFPDDVANMLKVDKIMNILENIKSRFETVFGIVKDVVTVALNIAGIAFETLGTIWSAVGPSIVSIVISIIEVVTKIESIVVKVVGTTVKAIKNIVEWLKKHKTAAKALGIVIGILATGIAAYNLKAKGMSTILKLLSKGLGLTAIKTKLVSAAQTIYIAGMYAAEFATKAFGIAVKFLSSSMGIVTIAIAAFAAAAYLIYKNWDKIGPWLKNLWQGIKDNIVSTWTSIKNFFIDLWNGIKEIFLTSVNAIGDFFSTAWQAICSFFITAWEVVTLPFKFVWELIKSIVQSGLAIIQAIIGTELQIISQLWEYIWNFLWQFIEPIWEGIKSIIEGGITFISNIINTVGSFISNVWNTIWTTITSITTSIWNVIVQIWNEIYNSVASVLNSIKAVIDVIWNAIKAVTFTIWNAIKNVIIEVWNYIKSFITNIINGIKNIVVDVWNTIKNITISIWNNIKGVIVNIWTSIKNVVSGAINGIKSIINGAWNGIKNTTSSVWNSIKTAIWTPISQAQGLLGGFVNKVKGWFSNLFPKIKLPHFKIDGEFSLKPPKVPHLGVDWYSDGAIFTKPTVFANGIGVGDAHHGQGSAMEAVLPINKLSSIMADTLKQMGYNETQKQGKGDITQNITINSPKSLSPAEIARENRRVLQELALQL